MFYKRRFSRKVPEINSSSTADIAFLLLIFFLMTTSMDTDQGLKRRLPQPAVAGQKTEPLKLKERNVLPVDLNGQDELTCGGKAMGMDELRLYAKEFIANPSERDDLPEKVTVPVPYFGPMRVTKYHVISLCCDRKASYKAYIAVQNALTAAYNELRDELARQKWGKAYAELSADKKRAVRQVYPQKISETEPPESKNEEVALPVK